MANYYRLVNVTKQEVYEPQYVTRSSFTHEAVEIVELLLGDWVNDEVRMTGDWGDETGDLYDVSRSWKNRAKNALP